MTPRPLTMSAADWLMLVVLSILWGGSFYLNKLAVAELPPLTVALGRVGIAAIVLVSMAWMRGELWPLRTAWPVFLTLGLINSAFALSSALACGLLGSKTGATLGKGLLLGGRCRLGGILVRIGIVVGRSSLLGLDRGRRGLAHRIDNLGLNNGRHLFLRLAELTDGTADRAAHLRELIRAKQQKAEDHDDCQLTFSNTKHTYLQGSM